MKKIIILVALLIAVPAAVFASFQPATLTNGVNKVAVYSQEQANKYFGMGYELATDKVGGAVNTARQMFRGGATIGGRVTALATSTALTANQVCDSSALVVTPAGPIATVTLPATSSSMFGRCLPRVGDYTELNINVVGTSTVIAAGAGGTLGYTSSTTIASGKYGILRIFRNTANTYHAYLVNVAN